MKRFIFIAIIALIVFFPYGSIAGQWYSDTKTNCKVWQHFSNRVSKESVSWSGPCKNGYASGFGIVIWYDVSEVLGTYETSRYEGEMSNGKYHGKGCITEPDRSGKTYETKGYFANGKYVGKTQPAGSGMEISFAGPPSDEKIRELIQNGETASIYSHKGFSGEMAGKPLARNVKLVVTILQKGRWHEDKQAMRVRYKVQGEYETRYEIDRRYDHINVNWPSREVIIFKNDYGEWELTRP